MTLPQGFSSIKSANARGVVRCMVSGYNGIKLKQAHTKENVQLVNYIAIALLK